ncbi:hypothetical protein KHA80_08330 [Anaerobacillus sp. HL2]|nr:hypothetical protein KHA80_08330 [Anaerobacillus sp. HL2]
MDFCWFISRCYLNWQFVATVYVNILKLREIQLTIPDFLENRFRDKSKILRIISAFVILIFFAFYTSSGLVGGALLFEASFLAYHIHKLYGLRHCYYFIYFLRWVFSCKLDWFFQGILMFLAFNDVPFAAISEMGGWSEVVNAVGNVNPEFLDVLMGQQHGHISLAAWGLGYVWSAAILFTRFIW